MTRRSKGPKMSRFGFIIHPVHRWQLNVMGVMRLRGFGTPLEDLEGRLSADSVGPVKRYPEVRVPELGAVDGVIAGVPTLPHEMLVHQRECLDLICVAAAQLASMGCEVVGLGALAALVAGKGREVKKRAPVPVTHGFALTSAAGVATLLRALDLLDLPAKPEVTVMGSPGMVALNGAALLLEAGFEVRLSVPAMTPAFERLAVAMERAVGKRPVLCPRDEALRGEGRVVLAASSTGREVNGSMVAPGSLVVDVAAPRDWYGPSPGADVLVLDGEMMSLPPATRLGLYDRLYHRVVGQRGRYVFACFAEPMVLVLSGLPVPELPARKPAVEEIKKLWSMATSMGFEVDRLFSFGRPLSARRLAGFRERILKPPCSVTVT